tara:strand:- start:2040 stop:2258 length:219 start_codon:yes stop_codon:yes gene_type:complete
MINYIIEDLRSLEADFKNLERLANKLCKTTKDKRFNTEDIKSLIHKINFSSESINRQSKVIKDNVLKYALNK